jgi:hypothetical protein
MLDGPGSDGAGLLGELLLTTYPANARLLAVAACTSANWNPITAMMFQDGGLSLASPS